MDSETDTKRPKNQPPQLEIDPVDAASEEVTQRIFGRRANDPDMIRLEVAAERLDPNLVQARVRTYCRLRSEEGFSVDELNKLDAHPLRHLERESRKLLVERANRKTSPAQEESEEEGPPWVAHMTPTDPAELPWRDREQDRLAETAKNPSLSRRTREAARRAWIKGQGGGKRRVPRSRV